LRVFKPRVTAGQFDSELNGLRDMEELPESNIQVRLVSRNKKDDAKTIK